MNKSVIATMLGTAALGLIKKHSGGFNNSDNPDLECLFYSYKPKNLEDISSLSRKEKSMISELNLVWRDIHSLPNDFFDKLSEFRNLKKIFLSKNELSDLPSGIEKIIFLKTLNLSVNNFDSIPSEIFNLKKLDTLVFSENNLTYLPPEIGNLVNLRSLRLEGNNLTSLPKEIGNLVNLQSITLGRNKNLTSLPPEIGKLKKLKEIYLRGEALGRRSRKDDIIKVSLPREFGDLKKLESFIIDNYIRIQTPSPQTLQYWMKNLPPDIVKKIVKHMEEPSSQLRRF